MLDSITSLFVTLSPGWLYLALFACAYAENIIPPIPGDTVTVFAAYLVGRSQQRFAEVFIATTMGSVAGFMTLYAIGRWIPQDYLTRRKLRFLPAGKFEKADAWFQRWGLWVVLANRFLSGVRSVISVAAGVYRLPWPRVCALCGLSCAVWNGLLIYAGFLLGSNWRRVEALIAQYNRILLAALLLGLLFWLLRSRLAKIRHGRQR